MSEIAPYDPGPAARFRVAREKAETMGEVAARMAEGETPEEICKAERWPYSMFAQWVIEDVGRAEAFARASRFWVDSLARRTIKLATDAAEGKGDEGPTKVGLAAAKLVIDTTLRVAGKLDRAQWGEAPAVQVRIGEGVVPDREAMLLETARSMAYVLEAGAKLAEQRALLKPIEAETAQVEGPVDGAPGAWKGEI